MYDNSNSSFSKSEREAHLDIMSILMVDLTIEAFMERWRGKLISYKGCVRLSTAAQGHAMVCLCAPLECPWQCHGMCSGLVLKSDFWKFGDFSTTRRRGSADAWTASRKAMPILKWALTRTSWETHRERNSCCPNEMMSIKSYCRHTVRRLCRHGQHVGSKKLPMSGNDVANMLLLTSSSRSEYMNYRCSVGKPYGDSTSAERPFAMHNVRYEILIIIYYF